MAALIQYVDGVPLVKFSLEELNTCIGRAMASDICIDDRFVSKEHALIEMRASKNISAGNEYYIRDLGSTNRTYVNNKAVEHVRLQNKDSIRIGEEYFVFEQDDSEISVAELKAFPGQEGRIEELTTEMECAAKPNKRFSRRLTLG